MQWMLRSLLLMVCFALVTACTLPPPAELEPVMAGLRAPENAIRLVAGSQPAVAVDPQTGRIHLVYERDQRLRYRTLALDGTLGAEESLLPESFYPVRDEWAFHRHSFVDPQIVLDADGVPHVTFSNGLYGGARSHYTNRIGGSWKEPLRFPRNADDYNRATTSHLCVTDEGRVFVTAFSLKPRNGVVTEILNPANEPELGAEIFPEFNFGNVRLFQEGDNVWMFGGFYGDNPWQVRNFSLKYGSIQGDVVPLGRFQGEQARASMDQFGIIHAAAGRLWAKTTPETGGWYQNTERARLGKEPIMYRQTMQHACGAALPLRDLKYPEDVYIFYWSGYAGNKHGELVSWGEGGCPTSHEQPDHKLHYTVIRDEKKVIEHAPVNTMYGSHGASYRNTPAAAALPEGGMLVVFPLYPDTGKHESDLWMTVVKAD